MYLYYNLYVYLIMFYFLLHNVTQRFSWTINPPTRSCCRVDAGLVLIIAVSTSPPLDHRSVCSITIMMWARTGGEVLNLWFFSRLTLFYPCLSNCLFPGTEELWKIAAQQNINTPKSPLAISWFQPPTCCQQPESRKCIAENKQEIPGPFSVIFLRHK